MDKEELIDTIKSLLFDIETTGMDEYYEDSVIELLNKYADYKASIGEPILLLKDQVHQQY